MNTWKKKVLPALAVVALVALVVGGIAWSKRGQVTVQTGKVQTEDLSSIVTASGQIKPKNFANVNANSIGKVTDIYVKEGDAVTKGQVLMRTEDIQEEADVDAQKAALKTAQADLQAQTANVDSAAAGLKTAQADLAQAQAKLKQTKDDYNRGLQLLKDDLIARQAFDQRLSDYQVALATMQSSQAKVNQARAQYDQAKFNMDMSSAKILQNRAQLVRATDVRDKTIYASPYNGIVTDLPVHVGEVVVPGIQNTSGSLLFQVSDLSVITAEVMVDETDIVNVKMSQPADVLIDAIPNKTFKGRVTEIGQSALSQDTGQTTSTTTTTTSEQAKQFKVVVTLDDPVKVLRPGLSTTAKITTATRKDAVAIPIQALTIRTRRQLEEQEKKANEGKALAAERKPLTQAEKDKAKEEVQGVFVVRNGRALFIPVETGIMGATDVEIAKGLKPGDEIVTGSYSVLRTLKSNTKVKIDNKAMATPAAGGPDQSS